MVEREIRSAKTSLGRHKMLTPFYKFVLKLFTDLSNGKIDSSELLTNALQTLSHNSGASDWKAMGNYFDLEDWIKAKLNAVTMADLA